MCLSHACVMQQDACGLSYTIIFCLAVLFKLIKSWTGEKPMSDSENMSSDMEEASANVFSTRLPENSREQYEKAYDRYVEWCHSRHIENGTDEKVLLHFFENKSESYKPSSLWSNYSMLRAMISRKRNVDISKYRQLLAYLKEKSQGYKPQKSKILSMQQIGKFLKEADDRKFLMMKAALIIGLSGSCRQQELANLLIENVKVEGKVLHIKIPNKKGKKSREFFITPGDIAGVNRVEIVRKYMQLRPKNLENGRFFLSYRRGTCIKQPVGIHSFGGIPKNIASFLKLRNPEGYTGHCFRRSSKFLSEDLGAEEAEGYLDTLIEIKEEQL